MLLNGDIGKPALYLIENGEVFLVPPVILIQSSNVLGGDQGRCRETAFLDDDADVSTEYLIDQLAELAAGGGDVQGLGHGLTRHRLLRT